MLLAVACVEGEPALQVPRRVEAILARLRRVGRERRRVSVVVAPGVRGKAVVALLVLDASAEGLVVALADRVNGPVGTAYFGIEIDREGLRGLEANTQDAGVELVGLLVR